MPAHPLRHPRHRDAADQRPQAALEQLARARVLGGEALELRPVNGGDASTIDARDVGHGRRA
jgi:hypothetical protein